MRGKTTVKFDMGQAWNDAMALLRGNQQLVLIIAGVFFFLPNLALSLFMPETVTAGVPEPRAGRETDMDAAMQSFTAVYSGIWWQIVLVSLLSAVGMLALLALLTARNRPTVGEALKTGAIYLLPYVGAQILVGLIVVLLVLVPIIAGSAAGPTAGVLIGLIAIVALLYINTKFSLTVPVIVSEETMNPVNALTRSWTLTKGNSVRLLLFYALLLVAFVVVAMVIGIVGGVFALVLGTEGGLIANSIIGAALNMAAITIFVAVLASVHRQLSAGSVTNYGETFE